MGATKKKVKEVKTRNESERGNFARRSRVHSCIDFSSNFLWFLSLILVCEEEGELSSHEFDMNEFMQVPFYD